MHFNPYDPVRFCEMPEPQGSARAVRRQAICRTIVPGHSVCTDPAVMQEVNGAWPRYYERHYPEIAIMRTPGYR